MKSDRKELMDPIATPPETRAAMEHLRILTQQDAARITEPHFQAVILPILTDRSGKANLSAWLDIVGTATRPIDVLDPTGNVLFRVPPLVGTFQTQDSSTDPRQSMYEILSTAEKKSAILPAVGAQYLKSALDAKIPALSVNVERAKQWNVIFARYNLPLIRLKGSDPTEVADSSSEAAGSKLFEDVDDEL